jgi:formylglycine-generating enzyme required for sulfatase activity
MFAFNASANNLVIGTPTISGNTISFTIQWDNSWRVSPAPSNWDAVWVFVKRQACDQPNENPWLHEVLASSGHSVTGSQLQVDLPADQRGVFIRRNADGIGNITQSTVTLTLASNVGSDNIGLFGMEMVNVPQGEFYIGDGRTDLYGFSDGNSNNPLRITASMQTNGLGANTVYQKNGYGSLVALPATFPLGYDSFYCMKYEITTAQYTAFLNTLTYNQQLRLQEDPNTTPPTSPVGTIMNQYLGYSIEVMTPGVSTINLTPAVYGNDANNNNVYNEDDDGLALPVSIRVKDFMGFLDWAALRPMTEFEYEKACRGPITPLLNEYAWGTIDSSPVSDYWNRKNRNSKNEYVDISQLGPNNFYQNRVYRVGIFATPTTDRLHAGATYYGIMDMTGNVFERAIGGNNFDYSGFTTVNGDGNLDSYGFANVVGWPVDYNNQGTYETYFMRRGGSAGVNGYYNNTVSSRQLMNWGDGNRGYAQGGRGVRSN